MVNVPRIHCHSAFKHYEMFHSGHSSGYGNSIFNTTYNFNGGTMCGGGFWGGLWGGLGMGLGAGLMNFLGGGFGMFGGGFPMFGNWGGSVSRQTDGAGGKSQVKEKIVNKEIKDRDNAVLNKLEGEIQDLEKKAKAGTLTEPELQALKDKVTEESGKSDKYHKKDDDEHYQKLLNRLNLIKVNPAGTIDGDKQVKAPEQTNKPEAVTKPTEKKDDEESKEIKAAAKLAYHNPGGKIKINLPNGYSLIEDTDISNLNFNKTEDLSGKTEDVEPKQGYEFSKAKYSSTKYPLYIVVKTNEQTYRYKCTKANEKTAVYSTPVSDTNNNHYVLVIANGELRLTQPKEFTKVNGYGVKDAQNDGSAEEILKKEEETEE